MLPTTYKWIEVEAIVAERWKMYLIKSCRKIIKLHKKQKTKNFLKKYEELLEILTRED